MRLVAIRSLSLSLLILLIIDPMALVCFWHQAGPWAITITDRPDPMSTLTEPDTISQVRLNETYGKLPLSFELNQGQTDGQVKFLSRGRAYSLFLTSTEAVLRLQRVNGDTNKPERSNRKAKRASSNLISTIHNPTLEVIRMKLIGANSEPDVMGLDPLPGKLNHFIGNDPSQWRTHVPTYAKVKYHDVYPGVDLVYYGNQGHLEYDFVIAPRVDPGMIRLSFTGMNKLEVDHQGDLVLHTVGGQIRHHQPIVYQDIEGVRQEIAGHYVVQNEHEVGFELGTYDADRPLVIDPVLIYSTFLGGNHFDGGFGISVDAAGNVYVSGLTNSIDFPTANPLQPSPRGADAFVAKIDRSGSTLLYSTYLGGRGSLANAWSVVADSDGNAYVTGWTESTDFPTSNPLQLVYGGGEFDGFVAKLDPTGSALIYSTYLGGSGRDLSRGIAIDADGNAYVTGETSSDDFPTRNSMQPIRRDDEAFVAKLSADGSALIYSTYFGGSRFDRGFDIGVDAFGNAHVTGYTTSTDFPTHNALQATLRGRSDAFVAKFNALGSALIYSTYLGGSGAENFYSVDGKIAVDADGNAYVAGETESTNFPTMNPWQPTLSGETDAFVAKLNALGSALIYSTYLGGSDNESSPGIAVDATGSIYVAGQTFSSDFPTVNSLRTSFGGGFDVFVAKLNGRDFMLDYSTYLGAPLTGGDEIAVDDMGNAYIVGDTHSSNFPTQNPLQPLFGGGRDAFIVKIGDSVQPMVPDILVTPASLNFGAVMVGDSVDRDITVANIGEATLTVEAITTNNNLFMSVAPALPFIVNAGSSVRVTIRFTPITEGIEIGTLSILSDDPDEGSAVVTVIGDTSEPMVPDIHVIPDILDFGAATIGDSVDRDITVANTGAATLTVEAITTNNNQFMSVAPALPFIVNAGSSVQVNVRFTPMANSRAIGTLSILSDDPDEGSAVVTVIGDSVQPMVPNIRVNPTSLNFGAIMVGDSVDRDITVANTGEAILTVEAITTNNNLFMSVAPALPFIVNADSSVRVTVRFIATIVGSQNGTLGLQSDDPDEGTVLVNLTASVHAADDPPQE